MNIDALVKRLFPVVLLALIGVAAYFQASGLGQLVAGSSASTSEPAPAPPPPRPSPPAASTRPEADALAILSRNAFDSTTGPLIGARPTPPAQLDEDDSIPACDAARVVLITWSEDPRWSFASIVGADGKSTLRRVGDEIGGYKLDEISWDRVRLTSSSGKHCDAAVGGKITAAPERTPPPQLGAKLKIPESIASGIHRIDETHLTVERPVLNEILQKQAELLGRVRALPGKDGVKLLGIRPGSLPDFLGMENGDSLRTINGIDLTDTAALVQAYQGLLTAERLTVSVVRRGQPMSVEVTVK